MERHRGNRCSHFHTGNECLNNETDLSSRGPGREVLLEILLIARNVLIINTNWKGKMTKETNWEQQNQETPK
jgi:hypothetical protein